MLEGQAHHALHVLGIHGVSMTAGDPAAARGALERYGFPVHDTPTRRNRHHKTVELPHPVDHEAGDRFNCILGRER